MTDYFPGKALYKIYVCSRKKDGTVTKSDDIMTRAEDKDKAIESVIRSAKELYGFKGKVHIGSIFIRDDNKQWHKL